MFQSMVMRTRQNDNGSFLFVNTVKWFNLLLNYINNSIYLFLWNVNIIVNMIDYHNKFDQIYDTRTLFAIVAPITVFYNIIYRYIMKKYTKNREEIYWEKIPWQNKMTIQTCHGCLSGSVTSVPPIMCLFGTEALARAIGNR